MSDRIKTIIEKLKSGAQVKTVALVFALIVFSCGSVGGTIAWMICKTDPIINTFTHGKIDITLTENDTGIDDDDNEYTNTYEIEPGEIIVKDPVITVEAGSEGCWLFVTLEKSTNFDRYLAYTMEEGWKVLDSENYPGVYYREVTPGEAKDGVKVNVLKDSQVTVKEEVDKEMLNELNPELYPTLKVTAYAVQKSADIESINTAEKAWELIKPESTK